MSMPRKMSRYFSAAGISPPQERNRASGEDPEEMVKREETSAAGGRLRLLSPSPLYYHPRPASWLSAAHSIAHPPAGLRGAPVTPCQGRALQGKGLFQTNFRHRTRAGDPMQESRHQPRLMPWDAIPINPDSVP